MQVAQRFTDDSVAPFVISGGHLAETALKACACRRPKAENIGDLRQFWEVVGIALPIFVHLITHGIEIRN